MITDISKIQLAWTLPRLGVAPVERPIDFLGSCAGFYPTPLGSVGYADAYLEPYQLNISASVIPVRYDVAGLWWGRLKSWLLHRFNPAMWRGKPPTLHYHPTTQSHYLAGNRHLKFRFGLFARAASK
jgi:hypothetical protein